MKLGDFFTLSEMCRTSTGLRNLVMNNEHLVNLTRLVALVLDPLRHECGRIDVTSGFRTMAVNKRVGGAADSFHTQGLAADIMSPDLHIIELSDRIQELGLPYDKLILEYREPDQWLHIQIAQAGTPHRYKVYTAKMDLGGMVYELVSE